MLAQVNLFFIPGTFGTTVEYILQHHTLENNKDKNYDFEKLIGYDGSMHLYRKELHPGTREEYTKLLQNQTYYNISTNLFPGIDIKFKEILDCFINKIDQKNILLYPLNFRAAELNMLFQYYKIADPMSIMSHKDDIGIFCGNNQHDIINWNKDYNHWRQMKTWELREWLSLFYPGWVNEWIESFDESPDYFLKISNMEVLDDTVNSFKKIIDFCGFNPAPSLEKFSKTWRKKQNYIINEFNLLDDIIYNTVNNFKFRWKTINIISESIVQQRLRSVGYEIRCNGLNNFPNDANTLYNLLERC